MWSSYYQGVESFTDLLSISVYMAVIKDFSTNYIKALGLNQAYMFLKLLNNYYKVLKCSFGFTYSGKYIYYSYKQKVYTFFLNLDFRMILKTILKKKKNCQSIRKIILILNVNY